MMRVEVKIVELTPAKDSYLPVRGSSSAAGYDLFAALDSPIVLKPMDRNLIPTGIAIALPEGYEAQIRPRSGLAFKHGVTCLNAPGTIDSDYRGEIKVLLINLSQENFTIMPGMRVGQMVVAKFAEIEWRIEETLDTTERAAGGFGSTGIGKLKT